MDNLSSVRNDRPTLCDIAQQRHTWLIAVLYIGTFGSFIGLDVVARPPSERLADTVDLAGPDIRPGSTVAVQVDGSGTSPELDRLRDLGAVVIPIPVYEWKLPTDVSPAARLARAVIAEQVHAVTFTTGPAVRNWMAIAAEHDLVADLLEACNHSSLVIGVVGPVCADVAVACGLHRDRLVIPATYRLGPLVRSVTERLCSQATALKVLAHDVTIAGHSVTIDGVYTALSAQEAKLLTVLAQAPNVVRSKPELLEGTWTSGTTDEHLVEVAIARLRRRLGPIGRAVVSVNRRGYALRP